MHHPNTNRVSLNPRDRQPLQIKQPRGIRADIAANMLYLRTLNQARDLAS